MFNNCNIEIRNSYKYLGVVFNTVCSGREGMFKLMLDHIGDMARKASFGALRRCKSLGKVTPRIGLHLFDRIVLPVIEYACEIWGDGKEKKELESVQLKFIKMLLGVKTSTSTLAVYAETGR